jgi:hypothetical protein
MPVCPAVIAAPDVVPVLVDVSVLNNYVNDRLGRRRRWRLVIRLGLGLGLVVRLGLGGLLVRNRPRLVRLLGLHLVGVIILWSTRHTGLTGRWEAVGGGLNKLLGRRFLVATRHNILVTCSFFFGRHAFFYFRSNHGFVMIGFEFTLRWIGIFFRIRHGMRPAFQIKLGLNNR